jgi:2-polyprenyl-6-methoxyphenol hydroxylase-like FAD-dependent oxidoreductase
MAVRVEGRVVLLGEEDIRPKIIIGADYTPGPVREGCIVPLKPTQARQAMYGVFAEIDRQRVAEAERAAERYRREMRPRHSSRLSVSFRRRRPALRLKPAPQNFT